jgi:predicted RNA-binding protein
MRYWINTVCESHVRRGYNGGFTQACHGRRVGLDKLSKGDKIIFYAPRISIERSAAACQKFIAHGTITDSRSYQVEVTSTFKPFRRKMEFSPASEITEVSVGPMIEELDFIKNKKHWGLAFRTGLFQISEKDYELIASKMGI